MREKFARLPAPLQKQTVIRVVGGTVFLFLFAVILIGFRDFYFSLPCLLFAGFLLISGLKLCYNSLAGDYMCVQGVCGGIETAGIRKRIRSILVGLEGSTLKIPVRQGMKALSVGDTVIIYLSDRTPVYEQEGGYMICSYYALGMEKRGNRNECG